MTIVHLVPATRAHVKELAANMSEADEDEVFAAVGLRPLAALERIMAGSRDPMTALADGAVAAMYGVESPSLLHPVGVPWLLSTDLTEKHWAKTARLSRQWVNDQRQRYDLLVNFVDARHYKALKWLGWLGFTILPPEPYGPYGMPFHRFELRSNV